MNGIKSNRDAVLYKLDTVSVVVKYYLVPACWVFVYDLVGIAPTLKLK